MDGNFLDSVLKKMDFIEMNINQKMDFIKMNMNQRMDFIKMKIIKIDIFIINIKGLLSIISELMKKTGLDSTNV
jgi:hypothetical protein